MDFYQSVTCALYARIEDGAACEPLEATAAYQEAQTDLERALDGLQDRQRAERAILAARRLADLQAQFFYRMGLQDGIRITAANFPAQGIA